MIGREASEQNDRQISEVLWKLQEYTEKASGNVLEADMALERLRDLDDLDLFGGTEGPDIWRLLADASFALRQAGRIISARLELLDDETDEDDEAASR